ncbi:RDD family protein [Clostridium omnivorum]|uniref:RDD domain-containing protein n=1 Tax=Clostridium omnivorum TaxID=1604902 RepID=A0ABQ5NB02_9CLOT|nr:hypothetical protein [Clostridium sp. E14]GLC32271.1 hypothetical protein bsdE14_36810 [Clostridium sp. E14]
MLDQNKNSMEENEEEVVLNEEELENADEVTEINEETIPGNEEQAKEEKAKEANDTEEEKIEDFIEPVETSKDKVVGKKSFFRNLIAAIVDEAVIGIISVVLLYLGDFILRAAGYFISGKISMLLIIFVVVSILYPAIMESTKKGNTIGRSI